MDPCRRKSTCGGETGAPVLTRTARTPEKPRYVAGRSRPDQPHGVYFSDVNDPAFRNITFDQLVAAYR